MQHVVAVLYAERPEMRFVILELQKAAEFRFSSLRGTTHGHALLAAEFRFFWFDCIDTVARLYLVLKHSMKLFALLHMYHLYFSMR